MLSRWHMMSYTVFRIMTLFCWSDLTRDHYLEPGRCALLAHYWAMKQELAVLRSGSCRSYIWVYFGQSRIPLTPVFNVYLRGWE